MNSPKLNKTVLGWSPLILSILIVLVYPIDRIFYRSVLSPEDGIIEWMAFAFSMGAAGIIFFLIFNAKKYNLMRIDIVLLVLYALGSVFFAGEEISWGQRVFGIQTEEVSPLLADINQQNETNLHNIAGLKKVRLLADLFCLVWGLIIPLIYNRPSKEFPVKSLRKFIPPNWLIPAFATYLFVTWPQKIAVFLFGRENVDLIYELRLGEIKETVFGLVILLFALHIMHVFRYRSNNAVESQ